ncbi:MFS transporter [Paraburkholderia unamae]|uniref:MHS family alpha-ketoglutarate permease-like MFS transporter n=1 Tax=Paraburkholderia unamae TaxID=219649 RepID=A0ABX5KP82_9BURK|nr:MFS transporter [Paraburkholderia unamae]PVX81305.1 MHS family alpha-ketoglutarate permease-like MFS transporter [Paraburkholderia unamae]
MAYLSETSSSSVTADTAPPPSHWRSLIASSLGNLLEWFDWTVYTVASVYIAGALFDNTNKTSSLLGTLAVFAAGFFARPLGGIVFGAVANRLGRRAVLLSTMLLMAFASLLIAVIPSYGAIGSWASAALLAARLVQGAAHGGETTASYAYVAEIAPPARRGLWSSAVFISVGAGSLIATFFLAALTAFLSTDAMQQWGWRVPFAAGGFLAIFALWLRRNMVESIHEDSAAQLRHAPWPRTKLLREGLKLFIYEAGSTLTYYTWVTSAAIYAISAKHMDAHDAFTMSCIAQVIYLIALPLIGRLSDFTGRKITTLISLLGISVTIFPLWNLISSAPWTLLVTQSVGLVLVAFITGSKPAAISEQVPTRYRTRLFGFFISLAVAFFGGTASYLNAWLYSIDKGQLFNVYLIVVAVIASCAVLTWKNNTGVPLDDIE